MERLPGATALARSLLSLSRSKATGVLRVDAKGRHADLSIVEGVPRAIAAPWEQGDLLGDLLVRDRSLDAAAHASAIEIEAPTGPIGEWLVSKRLASAPAVAHALRLQLRLRMIRLFAWEGVRLTFRPGPADVGVPHVVECVRTPDLVLAAMREAVANEPLSAVQKRLGRGRLVLTSLGEDLLADAALFPDEAAAVACIRKGVDADVILSAVGFRPRAQRLLLALRALQAIAPPRTSASFQRLLQKHREVRKAASSRELLELPRGVGRDDARRAFRRLAGEIHPDLFAGADPAIHNASLEVMKALVQAEANLRSR